METLKNRIADTAKHWYSATQRSVHDLSAKVVGLIKRRPRTVSGVGIVIVAVTAFFIIAPGAQASEVTITSNGANNSVYGVDGSNPTSVFVSAQVGYVFFRDAGYTCSYAKTTDGGDTWGSRVSVTDSCAHVAIWYDQWTPGDTTGSGIHIAWTNSTDNTVRYNHLDTSSDTLLLSVSGAAINTAASLSLNTYENYPAIGKTTDGTVFVGISDSSPQTGWVSKCSTSCDTTGGWSDTGITLYSTSLSARDQLAFMPRPDGDMMLILRNQNSSEIHSKMYDSSASTWDTSWTHIGWASLSSTYAQNVFSATIDRDTYEIYLAYQANNSTLSAGTADIHTTVYSDGQWVRKENAVTNLTEGQISVALALDENTKDVYVVYNALADPDVDSTANVYWKKSSDHMMSWGSQQGPLNSTQAQISGVRINPLAKGKLMVTWHIASSNSLIGYALTDPSSPTLSQQGFRWFANDATLENQTPDPAPTIVDTTVGWYAPGTTPVTIDMPSGVQAGDSLILFASSYISTDITFVVDRSGWVNFFPKTNSGTQYNVGWAKTYTPGMTVQIAAEFTRGAIISLTAVRGAKAPSEWNYGSVWDRPTYAGATDKTVAPGVLVTEPNSLVLSFFGERTNADEDDIVSIDGATKHRFFEDDTYGSIETLVIGESVKAERGISDHVTVTYPNAQSNNGLAQQIAIPPAKTDIDVDMTAWWEASDLESTHADSDPVSTWDSRGGGPTLSQPTSGAQPVFEEDALNGKPALTFSGSQWMQGVLFSGTTESWTRTVVVKVPDIGGDEQVITGSRRTYQEGSWIMRGGYGNSSKLMFGQSSTVHGYSANTVDDNWHVITAEWNSDTDIGKMYIDGVLEVVGNPYTIARTTSEFYVGTDSSMSKMLKGSIAAIFQADKVLSDAERREVHTYVQDRYTIGVADYGTRQMQVFKSSGTFTPPEGVTSVDVLIVGGGGAGATAGSTGGGGGAGGLRYVRDVSVDGPTTVTVGGGGTAVVGTVVGDNGDNSSFGAEVALGGGGGASGGSIDANVGGSGGGGSGASSTEGLPALGTEGQGWPGGFGVPGSNGSAGGGGGGGAGGYGSNATDSGSMHAGDGGKGLDYAPLIGINLGDNGWLASGGGGGKMTSGSNTAAGQAFPGGGGAGGFLDPAESGMSNTGGGGGGIGSMRQPGDGGSGLVVVFWDTPASVEGVPFGELNTPIQDNGTGGTSLPIRLRVALGVSDDSLDTGTLLKLQYKRQSQSTCSASGEYLDITDSSPLKLHDNSSLADGAGLQSSGNDPTRGGITAIRQTYIETSPFRVAADIAAGQDGVWDVSLVFDPGASDGMYCIRVVRAGGTPLDSYAYVAGIRLGEEEEVGVSLEQKLRGGQAVIDGIKSPFTF